MLGKQKKKYTIIKCKYINISYLFQSKMTEINEENGWINLKYPNKSYKTKNKSYSLGRVVNKNKKKKDNISGRICLPEEVIKKFSYGPDVRFFVNIREDEIILRKSGAQPPNLE